MTELTVIRCNHNYNAWKAVRSEVGWAFAGTFRSFERPTAADAVASGALSACPARPSTLPMRLAVSLPGTPFPGRCPTPCARRPPAATKCYR